MSLWHRHMLTTSNEGSIPPCTNQFFSTTFWRLSTNGVSPPWQAWPLIGLPKAGRQTLVCFCVLQVAVFLEKFRNQER